MAEAVRNAEVFATGLTFGESPRWHDGRLWFSDFYRRAIFSIGEEADLRREFDVPGQPSVLGWLPDGRMLIVSMLDMRILRREHDGRIVEHADVSPYSVYMANDMTVSGDGTAYVGNFGYEPHGWDDPPDIVKRANLVRVDPDGSVSVAAPDIDFPNGAAITPDGRTLIIGETKGFRLSAFDIADDASLSNRRVWAQFPGYGEPGAIGPDGGCLDADGCFWVANAITSECVRVAEGGVVLERVLTSLTCYACMLGGADRRTLFCLTGIPFSGSVHDSTGETGQIEYVRVASPGVGWP